MKKGCLINKMEKMISNTPSTFPISPITPNHVIEVSWFMYRGWIGQFWPSTILYTCIALEISGSVDYRLISTLLFEQSAKLFWIWVTQIGM
jgi:hypothetical protein